ncbi:MAG: type III-B CRISPR module RAMP protein Cmr4 [Nitrospirae bacterium]|nr:type III-B CRISPR module RAMP protein Cmr4 [Nitrospirota bacterium]
MKSTLYHLHATASLHVGTGQGAGIIDLPIAREKATHLPYVPSSGIKGVLREEMRPEPHEDSKIWEALFGPRTITDDTGFAGALAIGDARLLCFPVRSLAGTFAWTTCPFILARYRREALAVGVAVPDLPDTVPDESALTIANPVISHAGKLVLEDLDLNVRGGAETWATHIADAVFKTDAVWAKMFNERFAILPDGVFDFLAETATEVRARVRIDANTRTVVKGALWYEECLPAESLLYGVVGADRARNGATAADGTPLGAEDLLKKVSARARLQLGGNATVGRGLVNWMMG